MRICYLLLSPTFGMHQYTADLANRMSTRHQVDLVTSCHAPEDRYGPRVAIHRPVAFTNTGLSPLTLRLDRLLAVKQLLRRLRPDVVHITGPHLWNGLLADWLRRQGVRVIHTIHDLDPHAGRRLGSLLRLWNRSVMGRVDVVVVHGRCYYERLLQEGLPTTQVYYLPLLHLFLSYEWERRVMDDGRWTMDNGRWTADDGQWTIDDGRWAGLVSGDYLLFFGRLKLYKGVADLLAAFEQMPAAQTAGRLLLAGLGELPAAWQNGLPDGVTHYNRLIEDEEAVALFRHCRAVVLPYISATQSALIAAAYFFGKPVIVTESGALPEYVQNGRTGFVVPVSNPNALAEKLAYALTQPEEMVRMGKNGRDWYNDQRQAEYQAVCQLYESGPQTIDRRP